MPRTRRDEDIEPHACQQRAQQHSRQAATRHANGGSLLFNGIISNMTEMNWRLTVWMLAVVVKLLPNGIAAPGISLTEVPAVGSTNNLHGSVTAVTPASYRVAVYIKVGGGWWTKPTFESPLTVIQSDSTWVCDITTGGNDPCASDIAAFLVPSSYSPPLGQGESTLSGDLLTNAVAQVTTNRLAFHFSGYDWTKKESCNSFVGPGPNIFSASPSNVWVDAQGRLHLRITHTNNQWQCAEIISQRSFGYGTYRFYVDTPADSLDLNAVLGLFTWSNAADYNHREIDVELSRWSNAADSNNAQFVVQPWDTTGHLHRYKVPAGLTNSTHSFTWSTNQVAFQAHQGALLSPPGTNVVIYQWTFSQSGVPVPGDENARLNLWLYNGAAPTNGLPVEVVISRFVFVPSPLPVPKITSVQALSNGGFRLQANGEPQLTYILQTSSNLIHWSGAFTNLTVEGPLDLVDSNALVLPRRFYRLSVPAQ
jgi:hypothetical protein